MESSSFWRKRLQIALIIMVVLAVLRTAYVFHERSESSAPAEKRPSYSSNLDDYVTAPRIQPYDLKSAQRELAGKTVWVKAGNQVPYFSYDSTTHEADLKRKAGLLAPLEKLKIDDVIAQRGAASPQAGGVAVVQKQILAVFSRPGQPGHHAFAIGTNTGNDFSFTANDLLFLADPHELYKHWPPDVWQAIDQHEARKGMNELQVEFALGTSATASSGDYGNRTLEYTNNGKPVKVTFEKNKAVDVSAEKMP
jgi:hypothetical protein